jgi:beta-galactosidase
MKTGASYYPELSRPAQWEADLRTARSLGLEALRCGEFAWSRLSPQPDEWHTGWAVEFLELAAGLGFDVVWCTPSATPPPYLFDRWPDLHAVNENGQAMPIGVRRHYCPSHAGYRELCAETASRLARDVGRQTNVKGWQIDNEIAGDGFTCWCQRCQVNFQTWLEQRYGSVDALNKAWQTDVWAQRYTRWSQVQIPQKPFAAAHAPALRLAWRRFRSDNWLGFYRAQQQALKQAGATQPVTTNFYGLTWDMPFDHWAWRPYLDALAVSEYAEDPVEARFECALLKGLDEKPLWVLEQKAGQQTAQNLYPENLDRIAGHLRLCKEAGAEYSIYWHLRQHVSGCEMEHGAVLRHDGKATIIGHTVQDGIEQANRVDVIPRSNICTLVFDFDQNWAQDNRPQPASTWRYREVVEFDWHGAANDLWPGTPVGPLPASLQRGGVVLAPHFQIMKDDDFAAIRAFLEAGGTFVTTADFGRLDPENNVRPLSPLGILGSLTAVPDGEMFHLKPQFAVTGQWKSQPLSGRYFWFVPGQGSAVHLEHEKQSGPAFLELKIGAGRLHVLTSAFDRGSLKALLPHFIA